jgi:hypothetical protein
MNPPVITGWAEGERERERGRGREREREREREIERERAGGRGYFGSVTRRMHSNCFIGQEPLKPRTNVSCRFLKNQLAISF